MTSFRRSVEFAPAREQHPEFGRAPSRISFYLQEIVSLATVQFTISTGWTHEGLDPKRDFDGAAVMSKPSALDLGVHSPVRLPGTERERPECLRLNGAHCFYQGTSKAAVPVFRALLREGHDGVWSLLEEFWFQHFRELNLDRHRIELPPHPIRFQRGDPNFGRVCARCGFVIPQGCRYVHADWCKGRTIE